ncbi:MAG: nuclear transport factor 2 family protein, partial [Candidatus Limnocylindrales bacterium]
TMALTHETAATLLERYATAWADHDGDAFVALHTEDAESVEDPFKPPLVGSNALRQRLLDAAEAEEQVEFTFERHWVVAPTILAPWHASYVDRDSRARVRMAGFATFEIADDGRIRRARFWSNRAETPAG